MTTFCVRRRTEDGTQYAMGETCWISERWQATRFTREGADKRAAEYNAFVMSG